MAKPQGKVQPLCDQVVHLLADHKLHGQARILAQEAGEVRNPHKGRANRNTDADEPGCTTAVLAEGILQILGLLQQMARPVDQILALIG